MPTNWSSVLSSGFLATFITARLFLALHWLHFQTCLLGLFELWVRLLIFTASSGASTAYNHTPCLLQKDQIWQGRKHDNLLPRGAECSWWHLLEPSLARARFPGRARSRCPAGCVVPRRCRRPGQARCWCTGTLPGAGPGATRGSRAEGRRRRRCWCPPAGAGSAGARASGTRRSGYQRTCHILRDKEGKAVSAVLLATTTATATAVPCRSLRLHGHFTAAQPALLHTVPFRALLRLFPRSRQSLK